MIRPVLIGGNPPVQPVKGLDMATRRVIGVLGGMGPEASANLYLKILRYSQDHYDAVQDSDYPPVIIDSLTLEGFDETGITNAESVERQLVDGVKKLEAAGCDLIIIGCNTVHVLYDRIQQAVSIPILNIVAETRDRVLAAGYRTVGLFASESTSRMHLYQGAFEAAGIRVIEPDEDQQRVMNRVIEHVMGGNQKERDIIALKDVARDFVGHGAEAIVLGCTEIPLAINQVHTDIKLFDTIEIIVESAVDFSLGAE